MLSVWAVTKPIIRKVDILIAQYGEAAFDVKDRVHWYSGPDDKVWNDLALNTAKNHPLGLEWARKHDARVIDDTIPGQYLITYDRDGLYLHFARNKKLTRDDRIKAADMPWQHLSRQFLLAARGNLTTTINGASDRSTYYLIELPCSLNPNHAGLSPRAFMQFLLNPRKEPIEAINLIRFSRIHSLYDEKNWRPAHKLVSVSEQRMGLQEALKNATPDDVREALKRAAKTVTGDPKTIAEKVLKDAVWSFEYFLACKERYDVDMAQRYGRIISPKDARAKEYRGQIGDYQSKVIQLINVETSLDPKIGRPIFVVPASFGTMAPR